MDVRAILTSAQMAEALRELVRNAAWVNGSVDVLAYGGGRDDDVPIYLSTGGVFLIKVESIAAPVVEP